MRPHFDQFDSRRAGHFTGSDVFVLLPRDENSRAKVSNILNIGDGFLGDLLKLHIIASTNTPLQRLDPALLRPGRLTGAYHFRRLSRPYA